MLKILSSIGKFVKRKPVKSSSIIDNRLHINLDLDITSKPNMLFQNNYNNKAHLGNQLLLYDRVIIPTKDFGILPILINWLGLKTFRRALDADTFSFLHRKSLLGYAGNGNAISGFVIHESAAKTFVWWQRAMWGEMDVAVEEQLINMCPFIPRHERARVLEKVVSKSTPVEYDNDFFMKNIVHETYTDIMNNEYLSNFVAQHSKPGLTEIDLTRLDGVAPNQMQLLNLDRIKHPVDLVLRVAEINMEILMSKLSNDADLYTSDGAQFLLQDKLRKAGISLNYIDGFLSLLELNNIPDIRKAVVDDSLSISDIWKIRKKRNSKEFRKWLREANTKDARELEKLYVQSLSNKTLVSSLPIRGIRFALTCVVSALSPEVGLPVATFDNFFVNRWLGGYSPRLFLDELRKIRTKK